MASVITKSVDDSMKSYLQNKKVIPSMKSIHRKIRSKLLKNNPTLQSDIKALDENGYLIIKNMLTPTEVEEIRQESLRILSKASFGTEDFGGRRTKRSAALLAKSRVYDKLILNKRLNNLYDYYLLPNHLLSNLSCIQIFPGETQQPVHIDTGSYCYATKRPRKMPLRLAVIWSIDDFTETNGATRFIPRSHLWSGGKYPNLKKDKLHKAIMPKGSCLIYFGTIYHCGGANKSNKPRLAVTTQHIQPWIRQQNNIFFSVPIDMVKQLHPKIQSMVGYSVHPPNYGTVDNRHPLDVIPQFLDRYSKL
eukprot:42415_1